jgi:hypothetical protein
MHLTSYLAVFIVVGLVIVIALVSWYKSHKTKERNKKLYKEFEDFVVENKLTIDKKQTLNKNIIGLDRLNSKLIFIDNSVAPAKRLLINLADLAACNLKKEKNAKNGHISSIFLHCIFKENKEPHLKLPFYIAGHDDLYKMMRLSKKASYWEKTINIFREVPPGSLESH